MTDQPADRRTAPRVAATFRIRLGYPDLDAFVDGYAANISKGGIFVPTKQPRDKGAEVRFELLLKDGSTAVSGVGRVAWTKPFDAAKPAERYGMGVEFTTLEGSSEEVVRKALEWRAKHLGDKAAREIADEGGEPPAGARPKPEQPKAAPKPEPKATPEPEPKTAPAPEAAPGLEPKPPDKPAPVLPKRPAFPARPTAGALRPPPRPRVAAPLPLPKPRVEPTPPPPETSVTEAKPQVEPEPQAEPTPPPPEAPETEPQVEPTPPPPEAPETEPQVEPPAAEPEAHLPSLEDLEAALAAAAALPDSSSETPAEGPSGGQLSGGSAGVPQTFEDALRAALAEETAPDDAYEGVWKPTAPVASDSQEQILDRLMQQGEPAESAIPDLALTANGSVPAAPVEEKKSGLLGRLFGRKKKRQ